MIPLQKGNTNLKKKKKVGVLNRHFFPKEKANQYMQR